MKIWFFHQMQGLTCTKDNEGCIGINLKKLYRYSLFKYWLHSGYMRWALFYTKSHAYSIHSF